MSAGMTRRAIVPSPATRRRVSNQYALGLALALALALAMIAVMPARAGGECPLVDPLSDFGEFWNDLDPEYLPESRALSNLVEILFDPPGDTVDRGGSPAEGADVLCAMPFVVSADRGSVYDTLNLGGLSDGDGYVVVAPSQPSAGLLNAPELLIEAVGMNTLPDPLGMQLGNGFSGGSAPNYANPGFVELDGAHTWPGAFFANDQWNLDLTEYRDGSFTQGPSSDIVVVVGSDWWMKIKVPPPPGFADTWRSYVVSGNVVDTIDLGAYDPDGLAQVSLTEPQVAPSVSAAGAPATNPSASAAAAPPPAATTTEDGFPVVPVVVTGLAALAVAGGLVARTKMKTTTQPTSVTAAAADVIAADVAMTPLTGRAWKETAHETSGSRTALIAGAALLLLLVAGGATAVATGLVGGPGAAVDPSQGEVAEASEPAASEPGPSVSAPGDTSPSQPVAGPPFPELAARGLAPPDPIADALEVAGAHTLEGVDGEYFPDSVNAVEYAAWVTNLDQATVDTLFNATTFDCTNVVDGVRTACASNNPIAPGPMFVAAARFAEPIPQESSDGLMIYSLVLDADGDPSNNFEAEPPFTNDFFQGTDRWYELVYTPELGWYITVDRNETVSDARVAIMDDLIVFFVPMTELPTDEPGYRLTSFVSSDASFEPATSGGDLAPGPPDAGFELADPVVGGGAATGFLVRIGQALAEGDTRFLLDRLHSAVIDRYGASACLIYVDAVVDPSNAIDPVRAGALEQWDYETDGLSTSIAEAYPVSASATLNGQAVEDAEFHVAMEDGTFRWFTDCGTPAG